MRKNKTKKSPYYMEKDYPKTNTDKGKLGEKGFKNALSDFPMLCNITYGKRQKDIDHLVLTCNPVVFNECKNVQEDFQMYYSWFLSHVVDRFADGLPVAQYYARSFGYSTKHVIFTLTIPYLNTEPLIHKALKGMKIKVIQTGKQLTEEKDIKNWYFPIRRQFLSVINTRVSNTLLATDDESEDENQKPQRVDSSKYSSSSAENKPHSSKIQSTVITPYELLYSNSFIELKKDEIDFKVIKNPLSSDDIHTCLFCKEFFVCVKILKFRKAYKKELELWGKDYHFPTFEDHFRFGLSHDLSSAWEKIHKCLRSKLHLYFKKGWKNVFLNTLYQYIFKKRKRYLEGEDVNTHHPIRKERRIKLVHKVKQPTLRNFQTKH